MSATAFQRMRREEAATVSSAPITRDDIAKMKKTDIQELLEAHGADTEGSAPDLKARLISVMFLGGES